MRSKKPVFLALFAIAGIFILSLTAKTSFKGVVEWLVIFGNIPLLLAALWQKDATKTEKTISSIILAAYILRVVALILDLNGYNSAFTGSDTEFFYVAANGLTSRQHNYATLLKVFVSIFGDNRLILQYINVLAATSSLIILNKVFDRLKIASKTKLICLSIIAFSPLNILLSAALLRESLMIFLSTISLYFFIKWYQTGNLSNFLLSSLLVVGQSWLHSGSITILLGYLVAFIIYKPSIGKITLHKKTFVYLALSLLILVVFYSLFSSSIMSYFNKINSLEDIAANRKAFGGSDYLTFIDGTTSPLLLAIFTPLKLFYFFCSPMPWDCKSLAMILTFLLDSTIYAYLLLSLFKQKAANKTLRTLLLMALIPVSITYAWGTVNAGTAMRHREKLLPILVTTYAASKKKEKKQ